MYQTRRLCVLTGKLSVWGSARMSNGSAPLLLLEQRHVLRRSFAVQTEVDGHPERDPEEDGPLRNVTEFLRIIREKREGLQKRIRLEKYSIRESKVGKEDSPGPRSGCLFQTWLR